jgi:hypothetical protein
MTTKDAIAAESHEIATADVPFDDEASAFQETLHGKIKGGLQSLLHSKTRRY